MPNKYKTCPNTSTLLLICPCNINMSLVLERQNIVIAKQTCVTESQNCQLDVMCKSLRAWMETERGNCPQRSVALETEINSGKQLLIESSHQIL